MRQINIIRLQRNKMKYAQAKLYGVLEAQDFLKIFPQEYYKKFASHLKVLQFQKKLFQTLPQPGKLKFTKRQHSLHEKQVKFPQKSQKVTLNKFAAIKDTIKNDQHELRRFKNFNNAMTSTLNNPEVQTKILKSNHQNEIKIIKNSQEIDQKIIDHLTVDSLHKDQTQIRQKLQKLKKHEVFCKFTKRNQQEEGKNGYKLKFQWSDMKRYNSQKNLSNNSSIISPKQSKNISNTARQNKFEKSTYHSLSKLSLVQSKQNISYMTAKLSKAKNQKIPEAQSKSSSRVLTSSRSTNRIKSSKKIFRKFNIKQKPQIKINWIAETQKVKSKVNQMKTLLYSEQIISQPWKKTVYQPLASQEGDLNQQQKNQL